MELIFAIVLGVIVGIGAGLLPALPVFTGPMLLYYFVNEQYSLLAILIFWMTSYCGTQYYGSIATITTGIPGEESSAIYLKDISALTLNQKRTLLYDTALGSAIASIAALVLLWAAIRFGSVSIFPFLLSLEVQLTVFGLAFFSFLFMNNERRWVILLCMIFGLLLGPRQNYSLPDYWYDITTLMNGYTLYMVVLGTVLIPSIFSEYSNVISRDVHGKPVKGIISPFVYLRGTLIGCLAGLIPGPSASIATMYAYRFERNVYNKVTSAETANNAAVITCIIPFFLLGLPINQNTLIMSNIMDLYSINIIDEIVTHIDTLAVIMLGVVSFYFVMSTRLIDVYAQAVRLLHGQMKWIVLILLLTLIGMDLYYTEITYLRYGILLSFFTLVGFILQRLNVSPIPFLFSIILADKIIWLTSQAIRIYL